VGKGALRRAHHLLPEGKKNGGHASLCPPYELIPLSAAILGFSFAIVGNRADTGGNFGLNFCRAVIGDFDA
jgi:hypothetical protein